MPAAVLDAVKGTYTIPAVHTNRLAAILTGKQSAPVPVDKILQQVFSPDLLHMYEIPAARIVKLINCERTMCLVLCDAFSSRADGGCDRGAECRRVHADVVGLVKALVHVNYAWPSVEAVAYERAMDWANMDSVTVCAPGSQRPIGTIPTALLLKTAAILAPRNKNGYLDSFTHCAHYYYNRICTRAAECQFLHAVFIDPKAVPGQRAPAPRHIAKQTLDQETVAIASSTSTMDVGPPVLPICFAAPKPLPRMFALCSRCTPLAAVMLCGKPCAIHHQTTVPQCEVLFIPRLHAHLPVEDAEEVHSHRRSFSSLSVYSPTQESSVRGSPGGCFTSEVRSSPFC